MEKSLNRKGHSLNMKSIFRCMMEDGYYPTFEDSHIQFGMGDNIAVVEYDEDIISVRLFFSVDESAYDFFLEASNMTMLETYAVKSAVLDDMENIMFSCELMCDNLREFRKFFPRAIARLNEALTIHKAEISATHRHGKAVLLAQQAHSETGT